MGVMKRPSFLGSGKDWRCPSPNKKAFRKGSFAKTGWPLLRQLSLLMSYASFIIEIQILHSVVSIFKSSCA